MDTVGGNSDCLTVWHLFNAMKIFWLDLLIVCDVANTHRRIRAMSLPNKLSSIR